MRCVLWSVCSFCAVLFHRWFAHCPPASCCVQPQSQATPNKRWCTAPHATSGCIAHAMAIHSVRSPLLPLPLHTAVLMLILAPLQCQICPLPTGSVSVVCGTRRIRYTTGLVFCALRITRLTALFQSGLGLRVMSGEARRDEAHDRLALGEHLFPCSVVTLHRTGFSANARAASVCGAGSLALCAVDSGSVLSSGRSARTHRLFAGQTPPLEPGTSSHNPTLRSAWSSALMACLC